MADQPPSPMRTRSRGPELEGLAQTCAMVAAFVLAVWALWVAEHGAATLISLGAGFALLLARIRQSRVDAEARLGLADELELARVLLGRGAYSEARPLARRVAEQASLTSTQQSALETLAWCELGLGRPEPARDALSWVRPPAQVDVLCQAAVEDACGRSLLALRLLESAAKRGSISREARLFWIDLCARCRGVEAACSLTLQQLESLRIEDAERVLEFARSAPSAAAAALSQALKQARATAVAA